MYLRGWCEETKMVFINIFFFAKKLKLERESLEHMVGPEFQFAAVYQLLNSDNSWTFESFPER